MKKYLTCILMLAIQLSTNLFSQNTGSSLSGFPLKATNTVIYGTDVLIQPAPAENQKLCKISTAFNGWIYAAYIIQGSGFRVARSTDNGQSWTSTATLRASYTLTSLDIIASGNDLSGLRVWVINSGYFTASVHTWDVGLEELNGDLTTVGSYGIDSMISNMGYWGVAIASDYTFPSTGTSPYSLAVLYSKCGTTNDTIIFKSSSTGNSVFDNTQIITSTYHYYSLVALSFGRSPAYPDGKYFAAWKRQFNGGSEYQGEIYTSFTTGQYNGPWSNPFRVDTLVQSGYIGWNHPAIASQISSTNNIVSGLSTIILFDSPEMGGVFGVFSLDPITSGVWSPVTVEDLPGGVSMQPDITSENIQDAFFVTWCDSVNQQLKVSAQDVNITYPGNWTVIASGYNDTANLKYPFPRIRVNTATGRLVNIWTGEQNDSHGNAIYDGANLLTRLPKNVNPDAFSMILSPNPARDYFNVNFVSRISGQGILKIFDISGTEVLSVESLIFNPNYNSKKVKVENLAAGIYQVILKTDKGSASAKLVIIK